MAAGARREAACEIVGIPIRTLQDWDRSSGDRRTTSSRPPVNALSTDEVRTLVEVATSPEFRDLSPSQIVPKLADQGRYIASESTFYRKLRERQLLTHRSAAKPGVSRAPQQRVATGPNQVWSWDITWLRRRDEPGRFYYLYLFVDVWSRCIVGWSVETAESDVLAARLIAEIAERQRLDLTGLVVHSDNGGPMKGLNMLSMLQWLGVIASFSRPRVSDDNPFSESLFRTFKYRPGYPTKGFADLPAATAWVDAFVAWYNLDHCHSAIRFVTPHSRHHGQEHEILANRVRVYTNARNAVPSRWSGRPTRDWSPILEVLLHPDRAAA
ncbi:MAG: transposase [Deltaproteobacteria bacterium]|nr:transposase [Nannocystaceae bacterium]